MDTQLFDHLNEIIKRPPGTLAIREYDPKKDLEIVYFIAERLCPGFKRTSDLDNIYENAIKYFNGDDASEFYPGRGLYVVGGLGTGKTLFFRIFDQYLRAVRLSPNLFFIKKALELVQSYRKTDVDDFHCFKKYHLLIDDVGQHPDEASHFGSKCNVIGELFAVRYDNYIENGRLTHITTNLLPDQLGVRYGEHIKSRMKQMFNLVKFIGKDHRK